MKTGLVYSFQDSSWFSVTKIVGNLLRAYESAVGKGNIVPINFSVDQTAAQNKNSIVSSLSDEVSRLVILDHRPHPRKVFEWIGQDRLAQFDEVVIHIFGDFTLNFADWKASEKHLKGVKVRFVCASDKQVSLIQKFVVQNDLVTKCPFPVDPEEFSFDPSRRGPFRKKLGLKEEDFVFLYVGRMSLQKNIYESVELFLELKKSGKLSPSHKYLLAGEFDVIGNPYVEDRHILGEYFRKVQHLLESYPKQISSDVRFLGAVSNKELSDYYNGCDRFLSLSSYQDEDYGMAVAEACMCGLPCALSDWAGYSSFHCPDVENFTNYTKVQLGVHRALIDKDDARSLFVSSATALSEEERGKGSRYYRDNFSIQAASEILKERTPEIDAFEGFTKLLNRLGAIASFKTSPFMNEMNKTLNDFYYEVYDVYSK